MLVWNQSYATGIRQIDSDHVILLGLFNQLHINLSAGKADQAFEPVLHALACYCDRHFALEEGLMAASGYPDFADHKRSHDLFRERVDAMIDGMNRSIIPGRRLRAMLSQWLFNHIVQTDARLGDWLRAHPVDSGLTPRWSERRCA